jgi:hypothetical protein
VRCNGEALPGGLQPGDLAVWDGHVAAVVGKLLMGFPQKAAGSNPAGGTISTSVNTVCRRIRVIHVLSIFLAWSGSALPVSGS